MIKVALLVSLAFTCIFAFTDDFINEINSKQNLWRAGRNFRENITLSEIRSLIRTKKLTREIVEILPVKYHEVNAEDLPESFDARTNWPKCKTIGQIADQSYCASNWAISVTSTISDRICIHSDGKLQPEISARNLLACSTFLSQGCDEGFPIIGWYFWKSSGIVTGGPYGSKIGCQPFPFPPCEHYTNGSKPTCTTVSETPKCKRSCDDPNMSYEKELYHGKTSYTLSQKEEQIRAEIYKNGPVVANQIIYTDFFQYKSGIYTYTSGYYEGEHSVRLIGWGVENGTKYWLAANSWNEDWGDKGLFKIRRGENDCLIEEGVSAGLP